MKSSQDRGSRHEVNKNRLLKRQTFRDRNAETTGDERIKITPYICTDSKQITGGPVTRGNLCALPSPIFCMPGSSIQKG